MRSKGTIPCVCRYCGTPFTIFPCYVRSGRDRYCSRVCANRSMVVPAAERFSTKVEQSSTHWLWTDALNKYGYGMFSADGGRLVRAHRFALEQRLGGPIPRGFKSLHTCDIRHCVRNDGDEGIYEVNGIARPCWGHLWMGTDADNVADKVAKGRQARGDTQHSAKLNESLVREIRARAASGDVGILTALAIEKNVSIQSISRIVHRQTWKHVL